MATRNLNLDEEAAKALESLVETAVMLKESGMLDMLRVIAEKSSEIMILLGNDVGIMRGLGLAHAAHDALENEVDGSDIGAAKPLITLMTACSIKAMGKTDVSKVKPKGMFGMLGALRDSDVQMGLAVLLEIAKNLGACIKEKRKSK